MKGYTIYEAYILTLSRDERGKDPVVITHLNIQ